MDLGRQIDDIRKVKLSHMMSGFKNADEVLKDDDTSKADDSNNELDEEEVEDNKEEDTEVQKSDIMYALCSGGSEAIKISKSGKDIKKHVETILLPELTARHASLKEKAIDALGVCGNAPTKEVDPYWLDDLKIDCGFLAYDWGETYFESDRGGKCDGEIFQSLSPEQAKMKPNLPENEAQAHERREYNNLVRSICRVLIDIEACKVLKYINESKTYELTARQIIALRFNVED